MGLAKSPKNTSEFSFEKVYFLCYFRLSFCKSGRPYITLWNGFFLENGLLSLWLKGRNQFPSNYLTKNTNLCKETVVGERLTICSESVCTLNIPITDMAALVVFLRLHLGKHINGTEFLMISINFPIESPSDFQVPILHSNHPLTECRP